jgi:nitric oxide synthase-interacting protein
VACAGGLKADIFCRECALNDLVAQRKEIKRLEREWEDREVDKEEQKRLNKEEETRKELEKFERTAQGLEVNGVIAGGSRRKRKAEELEGAEVSGNHKLKAGDGKVHRSNMLT